MIPSPSDFEQVWSDGVANPSCNDHCTPDCTSMRSILAPQVGLLFSKPMLLQQGVLSRARQARRPDLHRSMLSAR